MSRYERFAVILDSGDGELGGAALGLIARGIDPLYAGSLDEALLAVREERRVGALVLPGSMPCPRFDEALHHIVPFLHGGAGGVVVVGPPPERARLRALCDRGIQWVVRPPYDTAELRFAVAAALATRDDLEPRRGLRVPMRLVARVGYGGTVHAGRVLDLSLHGAYVAVNEPPFVGCTLGIEMPVGDRVLWLDARVIHRLTDPGPRYAESEPGVGVSFAPLADREARLLDCFIRARLDSFRL